MSGEGRLGQIVFEFFSKLTQLVALDRIPASSLAPFKPGKDKKGRAWVRAEHAGRSGELRRARGCGCEYERQARCRAAGGPPAPAFGRKSNEPWARFRARPRAPATGRGDSHRWI